VGDVTGRPVGGHTVVSIRTRPGAGADFPGAAVLGDPVVARAATGPGLQVGTRFTDTNGDTLLAAIHHFRVAAGHP
jgi:hypothetical protein